MRPAVPRISVEQHGQRNYKGCTCTTSKATGRATRAAEQQWSHVDYLRNAGEQSTHRTQSRARVSQALDRVRQAARLKKKERFGALFHHLFRESFFALTRDAAPGVGG
jgi:RNA-directed DNA polymerase